MGGGGSKRAKCRGEESGSGRLGRTERRGREAQGGLEQLKAAWCNSIPGGAPHRPGESCRECVSSTWKEEDHKLGNWHSRDGGGQEAADLGLRVPGTVRVPGKDTVHTALVDTTVGSGNPPDAS